VGAVIVARQPRNRIGWLCCVVGLLIGPAFFAQAYAWYALVHRPGSLPGGLAMAWLGEWPWFMALALGLAWGMFKPTLIAIQSQILPNPLALQQAKETSELLETVVPVVLGLLTILSAASIVVRFWRARGWSASS
jgi:uncharacterized membrane protein YhaH (DUF805 family)